MFIKQYKFSSAFYLKIYHCSIYFISLNNYDKMIAIFRPPCNANAVRLARYHPLMLRVRRVASVTPADTLPHYNLTIRYSKRLDTLF